MAGYGESTGMVSGMGIEEGRYGGDSGSLVPRNAAEWIWPAKETKDAYHGEMSDGVYEMWWPKGNNQNRDPRESKVDFSSRKKAGR